MATTYAPLPRSPIGYRRSDDPKDVLEQNRARAWYQGDLGDRAFNDYDLPYRQQEDRYRQQADDLYAPILQGRGGYGEDVNRELLDSDRLQELQQTPEERAANYLSPEEQAAIAGDPNKVFDYFDPNDLRAQDRMANAGEREALEGSSGNLRRIIGSGDLSLDQGFAGQYPMSDADVQSFGDLGARMATSRYKSLYDDVERQAAGAGSPSFANAALKGRFERDAAIAAADAGTTARLNASSDQRDQRRQLEDMRLNAEQFKADLGTGVEGGILDRSLGVAERAGERGRDTSRYITNTGTGLSQYAEGEGSRRAGDVATNRQNTEQYNQGQRYNRGLGVADRFYDRRLQNVEAKRGDEREGRAYTTGQQQYQGNQYQQGADRRVQSQNVAGAQVGQAGGDLAQYRAAQKASGNFWSRNVLPLF